MSGMQAWSERKVRIEEMAQRVCVRERERGEMEGERELLGVKRIEAMESMDGIGKQ